MRVIRCVLVGAGRRCEKVFTLPVEPAESSFVPDSLWLCVCVVCLAGVAPLFHVCSGSGSQRLTSQQLLLPGDAPPASQCFQC